MQYDEAPLSDSSSVFGVTFNTERNGKDNFPNDKAFYAFKKQRYVHTCVIAWSHVQYRCTYIHTHAHAHTQHTHKLAYMHAHTYKYTHACTHTCTHRNTHSNTFTPSISIVCCHSREDILSHSEMLSMISTNNGDLLQTSTEMSWLLRKQGERLYSH